jgi:cyclohexanecarboxylate-CoA ligase
MTYQVLEREVQRLAAGLARLEVGPGSVATVQLPNWWETVALAHALWRLGVVYNPVVPIYRRHELSFILAQARPAAIVVPHRHRGFDYVEMLADLRRAGVPGTDGPVVVVRPEGPLPPGFVPLADLDGERPVPTASPAPGDVSLLLYTSGTTGSPKGVLHTHGTLLYEADSIIALARLSAGDRVFMPSPLTHITGVLYGTILPVRLAAPCTLQDRWDPELAAELVARERCTFTVAASAFLHGLADVHARTSRASPLEVFICGGADVPPELVRRARAAMGTLVVRTYGSSEMPTFCCSDPFGDADLASDTDGIPLGTAEGLLLGADDGVAELAVRGPELFVGYADPAANAGAFTDEGFFRTGDLASIDDRGAVSIRGRLKDIIIRGGENISAKEIEDLLFEHPSIAAAAVVGAPDPVLGERAWAFVVPFDGATVDLGDVRRYLEARGLAKQKWPEGLELVDELPTTASGKVQKFALRNQLRGSAEPERQPQEERHG